MFGRNKNKKFQREKFAHKRRKEKSHFDVPLILVVAFMLVFGLIMIFSASAILAYSQYGDTFYYFKRQIIWIIIGSILGFIAYKIPIGSLKKSSTLILVITLVMMAYMLPEALSPSNGLGKLIEMPLVSTKNGATRWIDFTYFDVQPAELVKIALIIFTAKWFSMGDELKKNIEKSINKFKDNSILYSLAFVFYTFLPFIVLGSIGVMILAQRDLDTIVIIVLTFISIFFAAGTTGKHTLAALLFLIVSIAGGVIAMLGEGYRRVRFNSFLQILLQGEPSAQAKTDSSFQVWNGLIAIGSGGIFGLGYNESRQKLFFLQEAAYTDSIFAVIAEEFGLIGSFVVILGFLFFASRGLAIAKNASNKFSSLLAVGLTSWIVIQGFLNIAANLSIIPFGGMPLPFFTYGGSNTITVLIAVGLLLNISREKKGLHSEGRQIDRVSRANMIRHA